VPPAAQPRLFPLEPLMSAARRHHYVGEREMIRRETSKRRTSGTGTAASTVLVEVCGLSGRDLARARTEGLTEAQADRCAVRLRLHPAEIWGMEWWDGVGAVDRTALIFAGLRREVAA
jgi:hypothetical protein